MSLVSVHYTQRIFVVRLENVTIIISLRYKVLWYIIAVLLDMIWNIKQLLLRNEELKFKFRTWQVVIPCMSFALFHNWFGSKETKWAIWGGNCLFFTSKWNRFPRLLLVGSTNSTLPENVVTEAFSTKTFCYMEWFALFLHAIFYHSLFK